MNTIARFAYLSMSAALFAATALASTENKTFVCTKTSAPADKLIFDVSGESIQFTQWKSAFGGCQMDSHRKFPLQPAPKKIITDNYLPILKGVTYQVNYDWYFTTQYFLTFEDAPSKAKAGSVVRLEFNGEDDDGCFIHHEEFSCLVK